jgi:hypothetical protein
VRGLGLLVQAYSDTHDLAEKNRVLHILDRALRLDVYGMQKLLAEHDRWWDKCAASVSRSTRSKGGEEVRLEVLH